MKYDLATLAAVLGVIINLVTLGAMLAGGVRLFTILQETVKTLRGDLDEHTKMEETHFADFRKRFHEQASEIQKALLTLGNHTPRIESLEETRREARRGS